MAKAARKDKAVVPDGPLLTAEKDIPFSDVSVNEEAISLSDLIVFDDVQYKPVTWSKEGPPPEGWKESTDKWDDWASKYQAPTVSPITYKTMLEEQAKLQSYKWTPKVEPATMMKTASKSKPWYSPDKSYILKYDKVDSDVHIIAPSIVRDFFCGVLRVMGGFRFDMCDDCDNVKNQCTCCSFCGHVVDDCECPSCCIAECDSKDAICDNCEKCSSHCVCCWCTSCEGHYSELTCMDCEHCEECGCTCDSDGGGEGGEYGSTEVAPWCARGIEIVHAEIAEQRNAFLNEVVDDRDRYGASMDKWRRVWPIDTTIDPTQSMAEFYLLDGIASMVFNGDRLISKDPSLTVIAAEARRMQDALVTRLDDAFVKYVDMAIGGELRYHRCIGNRAQLGNARHVAWMDWYFVRQKVGLQALLDAADLFREITRGGIGGDAWAKGAELLHARLTGKLDPLTFADRVFTLQHNGGNFINKIAWGRTNEPGWDIGAMLSAIGPAHSQDPPVFGVLLAAASRPVRQLFADWWRMTNRVRRLHALPQTEVPTLFSGATITKDSYRQGRRSLMWRIPTYKPDGTKQDPEYWWVAQWVGNNLNPVEDWRNFVVVGKIPFVELTGMQWQWVQFIAQLAEQVGSKPDPDGTPIEALDPWKYIPKTGAEYERSYTTSPPNRACYVWCQHFVKQHAGDPRLPEVTTMDENEAGYCIGRWVNGEPWSRYRRRWRDHLNRERKKNGEPEELEPTNDENYSKATDFIVAQFATATDAVMTSSSWSPSPVPLHLQHLDLSSAVVELMHKGLKKKYGSDYDKYCECSTCIERRDVWLTDQGYIITTGDNTW